MCIHAECRGLSRYSPPSFFEKSRYACRKLLPPRGETIRLNSLFSNDLEKSIIPEFAVSLLRNVGYYYGLYLHSYFFVVVPGRGKRRQAFTCKFYSLSRVFTAVSAAAAPFQ